MLCELCLVFLYFLPSYHDDDTAIAVATTHIQWVQWVQYCLLVPWWFQIQNRIQVRIQWGTGTLLLRVLLHPKETLG